METNRYLAGFVIGVIIVGGFFYFMGRKNEPAVEQNQVQTNENTNQEPNMNDTESSVKPIAVVETNMGTFEITLEDKAAPKTVANFIKLSKDGFYNNLTFHRIVQMTGFHLIQGGDPKGDGSGGPGYTVPAEIGLKHTKGAIATARTGDQVNPEKASSGSQFYITLEDIPQLDGNYTVFGYVTSGMDVVEKIGQVPTEPNPLSGESSVPLQPVIIKKITIK